MKTIRLREPSGQHLVRRLNRLSQTFNSSTACFLLWAESSAHLSLINNFFNLANTSLGRRKCFRLNRAASLTIEVFLALEILMVLFYGFGKLLVLKS